MSLLSMPLELLDEITGHLGYSSWLALSLTCRALHARIDNPYCTSRGPEKSLAERLSRSRCPAISTKDLFEIEMWPGYRGETLIGFSNDYFACGICIRLRRAKHFTNAMMKGKKGKIGSGTVEQRSRRICMQCCLQLGLITPGTIFRFGGASVLRYGSVCARCRGFEELGVTVYSVKHRLCSKCLASSTAMLNED